jgi:hypothetical protein
MLSAVAVGAVTVSGAGLVPAGAGVSASAPLTIEKEVDGFVPDDTEFTVKVECVGPRGEPIITTPGGPPAASVEIDFDNEGDPDGSNTVLFDRDGTCTVTETEDGDAEEVSYECEALIPPGASDPCGGVAGPQEDPIEVFIVHPDQKTTVTVTNEFPDPEKPAPAPAAQPLVVAPAFTG